MRTTFERVGDRILRAVAPKREAAACGWGPYKPIWEVGDEVMYESINSCSGAVRCQLHISGVVYAADCGV
ncbi:hypothetical protein SAMN05216223_103206 [Actinacidiphila yanglinensis]|uniref:Uncharacterized protein n=1 Tax=Actinacidiphila yanglinensis TaxID=310779 RepID=A0A1H5XE25_9ACTN|nr:hypothetical protein [Actinacidiphila yanglinensis]SEG09456.1 hypothetical protein SAMN05216223_103206 [Actinacidiphila yanglinensis]